MEKRWLESTPSISSKTLKLVSQTYHNSNCSRCCAPYTNAIPQAVFLNQLPSYDDFFKRFLLLNQLCVLTGEATKLWRCRTEWVCSDGKPNFDILDQAFGEAIVPVADCGKKEFSAHAKKEMKMKDFLDYWRNCGEKGQLHCRESLYLKDWHFTREFPDYGAYSTFSYFRSDWLNEFWDERSDIDDDYRFVYMGPKGTWTPFHADVFRSFSWSANICGRKRWIFYPPGEEKHLKDIHGNLAFDITSEELKDRKLFPNSHKAAHRIEIIQNPGETIFVPSGWHHQVENLEDTISVNHNWLNGCNIHLCWSHLKSSLLEVQQEISDCHGIEDWAQQCQLILRAYTGMDYPEFFHFMACISQNRIQSLQRFKEEHFMLDDSLSEQCAVFNSFPNPGSGQISGCILQDNATPHHFEENISCFGLEAGHTGMSSYVTIPDTSTEDMSQPDQHLDPHTICHSRESFLCAASAHDFAKVSHRKMLCREGEENGADSFSLCKCSEEKRTSSVLSSVNFESVLVLGKSSAACKRKGLYHWSKCNVGHALFDLLRIQSILKDMVCTKSLDNLLSEKQRQEPEILLNEIKDTLVQYGAQLQ